MKEAKITQIKKTKVWVVTYPDFHDEAGDIMIQVPFRELKHARFFANGFNIGWQKRGRKIAKGKN